jgi:hypothetical protein
VEAIRVFESGSLDGNPDAMSRDDQAKIAKESGRMIRILSGAPPFPAEDVRFLRSTFTFERFRYHSYFLDEARDLPWASDDPWILWNLQVNH